MQTVSITFVLRPSKANKKRVAPIEVSLIVNETRTIFHSGIKCKVYLWNKANQSVRNSKSSNDYLSALRERIIDCY
jgi:hypothetical protein